MALVENELRRGSMDEDVVPSATTPMAVVEIYGSVGTVDAARRAPVSLSSSSTYASLDLRLEIPVRAVPYARAKRFIDVSLALFLLVIGAPLYLITAVLVRFSSRGPIFFRQIRVGEGGRRFICYKFRSMHVGADAERESLQHLNEVSGPVFKMRNDPRVTPIGRWLRKSSIDELPQLWNVIRGEMSIVGPRPPTPGEVELYTQRQLGRLAVRPGLTCLWQVSGRSSIPFERWMELDLHYIETMSFWTDIQIILRTIPAVLLSRGAL